MCFYDEKTQTLQDPWCVDDVQEQRPDLNHEQSCKVLEFISRKFDASIGINWDVIDCAPIICFQRRGTWYEQNRQ